MVFNDTSSSKDGLIQECETWLFGSSYGSISGDTNALATFTRLLNHGLNETATLIMQADGRWQFDDSNFTDFPVATTTLVVDQQDYQLSTDFLTIERVEVRQSDGEYYAVSPIDMQDIRRKGMSVSDFMDQSGLPIYYDVRGSSIKLYPAPAAGQVTTAQGLKVEFKRNPSYFATSDTTKEPGIPSLFHDIPVLFAAAKYAKSNSMTDKSRELDREIERRTMELQHFFKKRNKDDKPVIRARYKSAA